MGSTDLNLVVQNGRLATAPELKQFDSGTRILKLLITVRTEAPRRRVDVVPVSYWDPTDEEVADFTHRNARGSKVWVCGSIQRRFWESPDGRRSRLEVVAEQVTIRLKEEE